MNRNLDTTLNLKDFIFYNWFPAIADHCIDESEEFYISAGVSRLHNFAPHQMDPSAVKDKDIIFCKTDYIYSGAFQKTILPHIRNPFVLVSGISSFHIGSNEDKSDIKILKNENLIKWFCTNPPTETTDKIIPMPIGFEEKERSGGNQKLLFDLRKNKKNFKDKESKILLPYHNIETNPERKKDVETLKDLPFVFAQKEKLPFKEYMELVDNYKYILCLKGSGPDVHRNYESLLVNSLPLNIKSNILNIFMYHKLPGLFIDSWEDLDEEIFEDINNSNYSFDSIEDFLSIEYHVNLIRKYI